MKVVFLAIPFLLVGCMGVQSHYDPLTGRGMLEDYVTSPVNASSSKVDHYQCDRGLTKEIFLAGKANCKPNGSQSSSTTGAITSVGGNAMQGFAGSVMIKKGLEDSSTSSQSISTVINSCKGNCPDGHK